MTTNQATSSGTWKRLGAVLVALSIGLTGTGVATTGPVSAEPAAPTVEVPFDDEPLAGSASDYKTRSSWDKNRISYFHESGTADIAGNKEEEAIDYALAVWSQAADLIFVEASSAASADIVFSWEDRDHGDGNPFGESTLAHAFYPDQPLDGDVHFNAAKTWTLDQDSSDFDLVTVAIHELGHSLGLKHSEDPNAIMGPFYSEPQRTLGADDIAGIQELYGESARDSGKGLLGTATSTGGRVFAWHETGERTIGRKVDLRDATPTSKAIDLPASQLPSDIVAIDIDASNRTVAYYGDGTYSIGTSTDLDAYVSSRTYSMPAGKTLAEVAIRKDNNHLYAWYTDGTRSAGSIDDLDQYQRPLSYSGPPPRSIRGSALDADNRTMTWVDTLTGLGELMYEGTTRDLDRHVRGGYVG